MTSKLGFVHRCDVFERPSDRRTSRQVTSKCGFVHRYGVFGTWNLGFDDSCTVSSLGKSDLCTEAVFLNHKSSRKRPRSSDLCTGAVFSSHFDESWLKVGWQLWICRQVRCFLTEPESVQMTSKMARSSDLCTGVVVSSGCEKASKWICAQVQCSRTGLSRICRQALCFRVAAKEPQSGFVDRRSVFEAVWAGFVGRRSVFERVFGAKWAKVVLKAPGNCVFDGRCGVFELLRLQNRAQKGRGPRQNHLYRYIYIYTRLAYGA